MDSTAFPKLNRPLGLFKVRLHRRLRGNQAQSYHMDLVMPPILVLLIPVLRVVPCAVAEVPHDFCALV